jgi:hypothetical protein
MRQGKPADTSTLRAVGAQAAARKYDLFTALGAHACAGDKHLQRLTLRLITLIVARYNWQADELCVGQREMAALWSVDERTVKRDMARLRDMGWMVIRRPAARGRVAVYGLGMTAMLAATRTDWGRVGPDFVARMAGDQTVAPVPTNIISFPAINARDDDAGIWGQVQAMLARESAALHAAWFAALRAMPPSDGVMVVLAPSRFHARFVATHYQDRLLGVVRAVDATVVQIVITSADAMPETAE